MDGGAGILASAQMRVGMSCVPVLHFEYSRCLFTVRVSTTACVRVSTRCLGARGAGGALQGGLGEASGEGSNAGICQRRGREQLVPAADCGREVQVLQEDLGHSHEALVVHTPVIPPHDYLWRRFFFKRAELICVLVPSESAGGAADKPLTVRGVPGGLCPEGSHRTREPAGRWDPDSSLLLWFSFWPSTRHSPAHTPSHMLLRRQIKTGQLHTQLITLQ